MTDNSVYDLVRATAKENHLAWTQMYFRWVYNRPFLPAEHFDLLGKTLDRVMNGEIKRLLINFPPRHGKSEMTSIGLVARIMAVNPAAKIMSLSYSDGLVRKNSRKVKQILKTEEFGMFFPEVDIHPVIKGDNHWETTKTGEVHSVTTSSEVTGFEAGINGDPWDGILLLDDPQKASQANSIADRTRMKDIVSDAITTRLNHVDTPVIVIQQRLHADDITAYLLNGGTGDIWDTLVLQAMSEDGKPPEHYKEYTHCRLIDYQREPGPLWPHRKDEEALMAIRDAKESDDEDDPRGLRMYNAQYQSEPMSTSIALYDKDWLLWYDQGDLDAAWTMNHITCRIDTARKGGMGSDSHAITFFGHDRRKPDVTYILDTDKFRGQFTDMVDWVWGHLERMYNLQTQSVRFTTVTIEDANVGEALRTTLQIKARKAKMRLAFTLTPRYGNKFERANEAAVHFQQGRMLAPNSQTKYMTEKSAQAVWDLWTEFKTFTEADTHASDDQLDTVVWEVVSKWGDAPKTSTYAYGGLVS